MAITFLGYIDTPEEHTGAKRRCLFGCDSTEDMQNLPTTNGFALPDGSRTSVPAPWSYAMVRGGSVVALGADGNWGVL